MFKIKSLTNYLGIDVSNKKLAKYQFDVLTRGNGFCVICLLQSFRLTPMVQHDFFNLEVLVTRYLYLGAYI
jgi:hypothetical protein